MVDPSPKEIEAAARAIAELGALDLANYSHRQHVATAALAAAAAIRSEPAESAEPVARPGEEYHEDMGAMLWWRFPIDEPPYAGTPNDCDWPGYHTHFTPIAIPESRT